MNCSVCPPMYPRRYLKPVLGIVYLIHKHFKRFFSHFPHTLCFITNCFHFFSSWVLTICWFANPSLRQICPLSSFVIFNNTDLPFFYGTCVCFGLWREGFSHSGFDDLFLLGTLTFANLYTHFQLVVSQIMYEIKIWIAPTQNMGLGLSFSWEITPSSQPTPLKKLRK